MKSFQAKNLKRLIAVIFFSLISFSCFASALKGVKEVRIIIEELDDTAQKCGITNALLDSSVRLPLSSSRLRVTNAPGNGYVYARATALELRNSCAVSIRLEFRRYAVSVDDVGTFWSTGGLLVWDKMNMHTRISSDVEQYTKEFIAEWLKANTN